MTLANEGGARNAGNDLRNWLREMAEIGELTEVRGASTDLEIGALTDLNAKRRGSALLFTDIPGYESGRVLSCSLSGPRRLGSILGFGTEIAHHDLIESLRTAPAEWEAAAPQFEPIKVDDGPVFENSAAGEEVDMTRFPAPVWHEGDGAPYIGTGGSVVTCDPDDGSVNCGTYRVSVHDQRRLGLFIEPINHGAIHIKKHHDLGRPAPIVASFGHSPLIYLSSAMPMPYGMSELAYAGAIAQRPIEVRLGELTGLPIPAHGEIAIEGFVHPGDTELEGPFGEFTGYFAGGRERRPVIQVERVFWRDDPIIYGSLPGQPPFDHSYWRSAIESAMLKERLRVAGVPDVTAVWKFEEGACNFFTAVAVRQRYAGHAQQAGILAALASEGASMGRYVVVVDDDIDVTNLQQVIWCMSTRTDPIKDVQFINETPTNPLDPMLADHDGPWLASRAVINACRPFERLEDFGAVVEVSDELAARVTERFGEQLGWSRPEA